MLTSVSVPSPRAVLTKSPGETRERRPTLKLSTILEKKPEFDEPFMAIKPPPWDRIHDIGFYRQCGGPENVRDTPSRVDTFARSIDLLHARSGHRYKPTKGKLPDGGSMFSPSRLFQLPLAVRLQIYRHIIGTVGANSGSRPIRLNAMVHNRLAWPEDAFDSLSDVLAPLRDILIASSALRIELLAALFLERSVHVTFSPYVRPATSPLAVTFTNQYGCLMQRITLELDCTRLGYGMDAAAAGLAPGMLHMDSLVHGFVAGQTARAGYSTMESLVVLCRRFHGNRPSIEDQTAVPYTGPEYEQVAQQLAGLCGLVDSARIVGFSAAFSNALARRLHGEMSVSPTEQRQLGYIWCRTPSDAYKLLPGHRAYLDYGPGVGVRLSPRISLPPSPPSSVTSPSILTSVLPFRPAADVDMSPASSRPPSPALSTPTSYHFSCLNNAIMTIPSSQAPSPGWSRLDSYPKVPWGRQVLYASAAYAIYGLNILAHHIQIIWYKVGPARKGPDEVRSYPCRPSLSVRVFFPSKHVSASAKLPTLFTIHGGGFVIGNPEDSDVWNYDFAHRHSMLVVALDYRKAPVWPFPCAIHDVEALALAVLTDTSLPIDASRVAMLGWSAGGNLALAVASLPSMKGSIDNASRPRIHAVVPIYPVIDFSVPRASKLRARQYKPLPGMRGHRTDLLRPMAPVFDWAYIRGVKDVSGILRNSLLSPAYLSREELPPFVFFIACELDMLSMESLRKVSQLAGRPQPDDDAVVGCGEIGKPDELILNDERFSFETRTESSSYRWLLVPDSTHGFDQAFANSTDALQKLELSQAVIAEWLLSGPFAEK
ncbi:alpha beta hydrolase fold protein [Grosmannia clavigera kw1407]|uniref:Alpha beta hydrolase fold protein n=1 Tax=Grosmannia clavigera (strain kw1407 / UAMH 11150) TaxID=655863 RepID=F0XIT0_GROCL|nr:alpha beta hydrolase fold protein [Grosmannia clavigera kw1407]EFX02341.1 alpha beta hydrolase fold protein [Grosmannia clavigera kw1407]